MSWFKKKELPEVPRPENLEPVELPELDLPKLEENFEDLPPLPDFTKPLEIQEPKQELKPKLESQKIIEEIDEDIENIPKEKFVDKVDYEEAMNLIGNFDSSIKNSQAILDSLVELKNNADHKLEEWRLLLEDAERKLVYADRVMFE